jgi:hypothetical protein
MKFAKHCRYENIYTPYWLHSAKCARILSHKVITPPPAQQILSSARGCVGNVLHTPEQREGAQRKTKLEAGSVTDVDNRNRRVTETCHSKGNCPRRELVLDYYWCRIPSSFYYR